MCNCISEAKVNLEAHLKAQIKPETVYSYDEIGFDNECFMLGGNTIGTAIGIPFSIEYYGKKKDGSRSSKLTKVKTNLFPSYCFLCGEKLPTRD
jgi:hypothetical protein